MQITRTWANVDLARLEQNYNALHTCLNAGIEVLRMVNANAYTFEPMVGGPMQGIGPQYLAVKTIQDGCRLRKEGVTLPILVLDFPYPDDLAGYVKTLHRNFLAQSIDCVRACRAIANRTIPAYGGVICAHIKVQIGAEGEGYHYQDAGSVIDEMLAAKSNLGLYCAGIYTELDANATESEKMEAVKAMNQAARRLEEATGKPFAIRHVFLK